MTDRRTMSRPLPPARHLLAALIALCLISIGAPAVAGSTHSGAVRGETMVPATSHLVSVARALPDRVLANQLPAKQLPAAALLPSALLVALLLVLSAPRRSLTGAAKHAQLLSAAGPGPPSHS